MEFPPGGFEHGPPDRGEGPLGGTGWDALGEHPGGDDGPYRPWLPPEDRLWRHPSESPEPAAGAGSSGRDRAGVPPPVAGAAPAGLSRRRSRRVAAAQDPDGPAGWGRYPVGRARPVALAAVVGGLVGACAVGGIATASGAWSSRTTVLEAAAPTSPTVSLAGSAAAVAPSPDWSAVDDSVAPSVVSVDVDGAAGREEGSGVVLYATGSRQYVVTDRALFSPSQEAGEEGSVTVTFLSGTAASGKLVGSDPASELAVVAVASAPGAVRAATGSVAELSDADPVLAVGSRTLPSLSTGAVCGEDRTVPLADGTSVDNLVAVTMPALGPAASGGPLLDRAGRVVGITVGLDPLDGSDQALTFAVPIDEAVRVSGEVIAGRQVTHPWLGVRNAAGVPAVMARQLGLSGGVQVGEVAPGSPAADAGVAADDIVTSYGGRPVSSAGELVSDVEAGRPGQQVVLGFVHQGAHRQETVRLGHAPTGS